MPITQVVLLCLTFALCITMTMSAQSAAADDAGADGSQYPAGVRVILENTKPLTQPLADRFPLLLWPAHDCVVQDEGLQERIVVDLHKRGVAAFATWQPGKNERDKALADGLRLARIQQKLGLKVCVNANACMYSFNNGDPSTAYVDADGKPFFDKSIPNKIGSPFRLDHRYAAMREQVEFFARGYREAGVPLDFVYGDWEIDGPLEVNHAWDAAKRCTVTREHIPDIDTKFKAFQKAVREKRGDMTKQCYTDPLLSRYPEALVGNYAVYPHNGYRYWYDYFEYPVDHHPHVRHQNAMYREWFDEFPLTGYTFAMPVVYPWSRIYDWYTWTDTDYRWFHNMLRIASNAGEHTRQGFSGMPVIAFIHWHTIFQDTQARDTQRFMQFSEEAYRELVWHVTLRGVDALFLWCMSSEYAKEVELLHGVWSQTLRFADFLTYGEPVLFDVPDEPGPVVSAVRWNGQLLVRRTDFGIGHDGPVDIQVAGKTYRVPKTAGKCKIIELNRPHQFRLLDQAN